MARATKLDLVRYRYDRSKFEEDDSTPVINKSPRHTERNRDAGYRRMDRQSESS